jgi:solute carrier family 25 carnitine/acylcarnitine transporter 20/29
MAPAPAAPAAPAPPPAAASPPRWLADALRDIVSGTVAGSCGIAVGYPLDTLKVILQTSPIGGAAGGGTSSGTSSGASASASASAPRVSVAAAARDMLRAGGLRAFFRGLSSPIVANAPINAIVFAVEAASTRYLAATQPGWSSPFQHAVAGSLAGLSQVWVSCPSELVKVQMQIAAGPARLLAGGGGAGGAAGSALPALAPHLSSSWACARHIVRRHGAAALFRGLELTLLRDTLSWGVYFGVYDLCKREMAARQRQRQQEQRGGGGGGGGSGSADVATAPLSLSAIMMCGGLAGVASWLLLHPVDVLKSIQQGASLALPPAERSVAALWRASAAEHGGHGFLLRGLGTTLVRAFPTSAITFPIFEASVAAIDTWRNSGALEGEGGAAAAFREEQIKVAARVGAGEGAEPEATSGGHR